MNKISAIFALLFVVAFSYLLTWLLYELGEPRAVWFFNLMGISQ